MKGGGKVNYTSGSLARAKSKSKSSPSRPRPSIKALFPPRILLLTPKSKPGAKSAAKSSVNVKEEIDLEESATTNDNYSPRYKEVMSKEDWMRDSDFAMARLAPLGREEVREVGRWWDGFGLDKAGRAFEVEVKGILGKEEGDQRTELVGEQQVSVKAGDGSAGGLFDRPECLDLPHWLRPLPRQQLIIPETPAR